MTKVAFVGLGVMGGPMASHLSKAGMDVRVHNRTRSKAEAWVAGNVGRVEETPLDAALGCKLVLSCVGNDDDLRGIAYGERGIFSALDSGGIWVDHTTSSAEVARELALAASARGIRFLDAPVSGGEAGAKAGKLSVMVGGDASALEEVRPVLDHYSKHVGWIGPSGSGQLAKMVNQICIAGLLQGLSEALRFGEHAGLEMERVLEVISKGAAQSWQMDNRAKTMLERRFDFGFAVDWMRKDLGLCVAEAARNGSTLVLATQTLQRYDTLSERGHGRSDTSSLIRLLDGAAD